MIVIYNKGDSFDFQKIVQSMHDKNRVVKDALYNFGNSKVPNFNDYIDSYSNNDFYNCCNKYFKTTNTDELNMLLNEMIKHNNIIKKYCDDLDKLLSNYSDKRIKDYLTKKLSNYITIEMLDDNFDSDKKTVVSEVEKYYSTRKLIEDALLLL